MDIGQLMMSGHPRIDSGDICDAGHDDVKIVIEPIRPLHHRMRLAGPVFTVEQPGGSNYPTLEAIEKAPAGCVLVIHAQASMQSGHFGSLMALACQLKGIVGAVIDGAVRDVPDMIEMQFPIFARGTMPRGNRIAHGVLGNSIQFGGVTVTPEDMIFADATGIVFFSKSKAEVIYNQAVSISINELGIRQKMSQGLNLLEIPAFPESRHHKK